MSFYDLMPCPHCAHTDNYKYQRWEPDNGGIVHWAVVCGNCGAAGPSDTSTEAARDMWNLRRVPALTEPTLAAIRELCNCVDVVAAAPFAMPELAGAYLDDVATVRAWLDSYRGREP